MNNTILMAVAALLSLTLGYVGLYLAVRPLGQGHPKRIAVVLCFVFSVVALLAAIYIGSNSR